MPKNGPAELFGFVRLCPSTTLSYFIFVTLPVLVRGVDKVCANGLPVHWRQNTYGDEFGTHLGFPENARVT